MHITHPIGWFNNTQKAYDLRIELNETLCGEVFPEKKVERSDLVCFNFPPYLKLYLNSRKANLNSARMFKTMAIF